MLIKIDLPSGTQKESMGSSSLFLWFWSPRWVCCTTRRNGEETEQLHDTASVYTAKTIGSS
jgi:hypothetical protein